MINVLVPGLNTLAMDDIESSWVNTTTLSPIPLHNAYVFTYPVKNPRCNTQNDVESSGFHPISVIGTKIMNKLINFFIFPPH